MTYLLVDLVVLAVVLPVSAVLLHRSPRGALALIGVTLLVVGVFTAVFDSLMIAVGLFTYAPQHLVGARIGLAPVEDFAYVIVAAVLLPSLWIATGGGRTAVPADEQGGSR